MSSGRLALPKASARIAAVGTASHGNLGAGGRVADVKNAAGRGVGSIADRLDHRSALGLWGDEQSGWWVRELHTDERRRDADRERGDASYRRAQNQ